LSGFLLDTNVISLLSPLKKVAISQAFVDWRDKQARTGSIYVSAVTIHEIERGARLLLHKGATNRAATIHKWLLELTAEYDANVLPLDGDVARLSGELEALAISAGHAPSPVDAMVAGTAKAYGLVVVTHNAKHFLPLGVDVMTPEQIAL
jgi:predicted nucleic acid-binding protein